MSSININLTPYLKQYVEDKIDGGRYNNVSEVVREALRLLEQQDIARDAKLQQLRVGQSVVHDTDRSARDRTE